jgi:hypothetical protein
MLSEAKHLNARKRVRFFTPFRMTIIFSHFLDRGEYKRGSGLDDTIRIVALSTSPAACSRIDFPGEKQYIDDIIERVSASMVYLIPQTFNFWDMDEHGNAEHAVDDEASSTNAGETCPDSG